jgi:hypothetical protein
MSTITTASQQWASRPDDERFTSLHDLSDHFHRIRELSASKVVTTRQISVEPVEGERNGLQVVGPNGNGYAPTHWSFGQLASLAKAPAGYLRTLPGPLAADNINYGLKFARESEEVGVLLQRGDEPQLRAATGPSYGRIWNSEVSDALVSRFGDGVTGDWKVPGEFGHDVAVTKRNTTIYGSDRDMFVFLADEHNKIEVPDRRDGQPGAMSRGFFVWNSEVGATSIGASFFLFDYVCMNRIVWGARDYKEIRLRHSLTAPDRWLEEVTPVLIEYSKSSAQPVIDAVAAAKAAKLDNVDEWLAKRYSAKQAVTLQAVHGREENRPIETLWDVSTALTAQARDLTYQDARVAQEREAGKVLALAA